jgi:hypothetical protein
VLHLSQRLGTLAIPTTKHRIAVNLDDQEFADLAAMANKHDVSLAWLGRQALIEFRAWRDDHLWNSTTSGCPEVEGRRLADPYNPLDNGNLGISVRDALLKQQILPMPPWKFGGAGIYAIYYTGDFPPYAPIAEQNRDGRFECRIYVGKAVPKGSRKGGLVRNPQASTAIADRLKRHADSIKAAQNLDLADFFFRYLVVDDIWIPLGEMYMIEKFQPVWNKVVEGFGIKTPGKRRKGLQWDTIHPGRKFVGALGSPPHPKSPEQILTEVKNYLAMPQAEKAKVPVKEYGSENEDDE